MTPPPGTPDFGSDFSCTRPGALIAALPAVLGFVPERSLILVTVDEGEPGCVMRIDLSPSMAGRVEHLAGVAAASAPQLMVAVIVDEDGLDCRQCREDYEELAAIVDDALSGHGIELLAAHVVDRVAVGGRWQCADQCGRHGFVEDPAASPFAVAAVLEGRPIRSNRDDLQQVVDADPVRAERVGAHIEGLSRPPADRRHCEVRADVDAVMVAAGALADGSDPADATLARLAVALTDPRVRDIVYALAVGERAEQAESLWLVLARALPAPWRADALVQLAFSAYIRGDGPLAGVSLDAALRCDPQHRMAGMLDAALQTGMRPEQIRELALSGYRQADRLGVMLPPRRIFAGRSRRAGA
ncbi:DUF4192 domain-containing protein [Mycobacterium sp. NPDC003449]